MSRQSSARTRPNGYAVEDYDPGAPSADTQAAVADAVAVIRHGRGETDAAASEPASVAAQAAPTGYTPAELQAAVDMAVADILRAQAARTVVVGPAAKAAAVEAFNPAAVAAFARECGAA